MRRKHAVVISLIVACLVLTGAVWKFRHRTANAAAVVPTGPLHGLSAEQIVGMLQHQALVEPDKVYSIVQNDQSRKVFLSGLRDYLALASRARSEGLADSPDIKLNIEYKQNVLLASLYQNKLDNQLQRYYELPTSQIESYLSNSENEKQFQLEQKALRAVQQAVVTNSGNPLAAPELQEETLNKGRKEWAKVRILSDMAKNDTEFMAQPAIGLRLRVAEAGVLAFNYVNRNWLQRVLPTDEEVTAFLASHPEYDPAKKLEKAASLLVRAKAGEDFARLAGEFSEDRASKDKGGLYENVPSGYLWAEVEAAALKLSKGQVADQLVETQHGYHIVQLVNKSDVDEIKLSVRHILIRRTFEEPGTPLNSTTPPAFLSAREAATIVVRNEKRRRFIDEIARAENISLPEDFSFEVTEELKAASQTRAQQAADLIRKDQQKQKSAPSAPQR
jgi:parvulin-like peptidyl-prolyl isomerase